MTLNIQQVLISDPVDPICSQILQDYGMNVTYARQWTKERLLQEIQVLLFIEFLAGFPFSPQILDYE